MEKFNENNLILCDDELVQIGSQIPGELHGMVINDIIANANILNGQVHIFIRDERELQNYYPEYRFQQYLPTNKYGEATEYLTKYSFLLKGGNKHYMLVRSIEYLPLSHPHLHHQNVYEVVKIEEYNLKTRKTSTLFASPSKINEKTPVIYYPRQKSSKFVFEQPETTDNSHYSNFSISRTVPASNYSRSEFANNIPKSTIKVPKAPQGPKTPQPGGAMQINRESKINKPVMPSDYEKEKE